MIEFNQLEQLICIVENGTISKAAQILLISQPALSRSMHRLESDIGVSLFDHYRNKVVLNANGELVYKHAKKLVENRDKMIQEAKLFDALHRSISINSCTPAPVWDIEPLLKTIYPNIDINYKIIENDLLVESLRAKECSMIIAPFEINDKDLFCIPYIEEDLCLSVPKNHPLVNQKEVSFSDLDGETMLLYSNIGFWYDLHLRSMPNTKFLIQSERTTFNELVKASTLPSFTTNLSIKREGKMPNRTIIPFSDDEAHVTFFIIMLKENKEKYADLIKAVENYYDY